MRFMTLTEMLTELRGEIGVSQNIAHGVLSQAPQSALLRRVQEDLYLGYDWPHITTSATVTILAGGRYSAYPVAFDFPGINEVWAKSPTGKWIELTYGIGSDQLNFVDSDSGAQAGLVSRWQNYMQPDTDTNNNMFEVWPVPNLDTTFRFIGKRKLYDLTTGDKKSTLDGPMIVLAAAAEILAKQKSEDAGLKLQKGLDRARLLKLRQAKTNNEPINMSGGAPSGRSLRRGIDYM